MTLLSGNSTMIETWLRDIGIDPNPVTDPEMHWRFDVNYPTGSPHRMHVVNPKARPRAVAIISRCAISAEHHAAFQELDGEAKLDFARELQATLNREFVEFTFQGVEQGLLCPTGFQVEAMRYDDALSLDSLARSISSVYKAELAAIWCVQRHLTPHGAGGSGHFEFKRMGGVH